MSALDAAGTSTPPTPSPPRRRHPHNAVLGPSLKKDVAVLKASGMTTHSIAKTLGKHRRTIVSALALPDVKANIAELRHIWKQEAQTQVTGLAEDAWTMASSFIEQRDSKGFDNSMRGLVAMEKISASVSGEGQKVEVTGTVQGPPQVELKALVYQLFGQRPLGD